MRRKCRIWWPKDLNWSEPSSSYGFLFGWFISCSSASIDIVVAFSCNEIALVRCQSGLQEILRDANGNMPTFLQEKSMFSLLGQYVVNPSDNEKILKVGMEEDAWRMSSTQGVALASNKPDMFTKNYGERSCGCGQLDGLVEQTRKSCVERSHWIQIVYDSHSHYGRGIRGVPRLHHIHWNGQIVSQCDVHVIVYEIPMFGVHHFSMNFWNSPEQVKAPCEKPKWFNELHKSQIVFDLGTVILAINSAAAANKALERHVGTQRSHASFFISCMCLAFTSEVVAISVASISTLYFIVLKLFHSFSTFGSKTWINITTARVFCTTWKNIQVRCCQILYWPIFLQDNGLRSRSSVEYAEKAALHRHSMWSSTAVDLLFGNMIGLALLLHAESACIWVLAFASAITNELLRTGCVWLMGVPAGFKLNTELAGILGMFSLNVIQIWSTLWTFIAFLFIYFIKGLAVSGILFGATVPAAFVKDMVALATLHVSTLHWAISFVYSWQIQALAALWRLFRGRKWNPLRQRLDSYDYTVKQHVAGSLLFAPLLLLLPTTSVFYIFFTILNTAVSLTCILIEVAISMIHSMPYIKIFLWLVSRRRFPFGIWFEIVSFQNDSVEFVCLDKVSSSSENSQQQDSGETRSSILVSVLHSNFLSIGQVVLPHCKKVFFGLSGFATVSAYEALTGRRTASTLRTSLPSTMPWMFIPSTEYWRLCHNSIIACFERT